MPTRGRQGAGAVGALQDLGDPLLSSRQEREALKGAAATSTLVQTAATVGGSRQNGNAQGRSHERSRSDHRGRREQAPDRKRNVMNIEQEE